jgi:protein SCO1
MTGNMKLLMAGMLLMGILIPPGLGDATAASDKRYPKNTETFQVPDVVLTNQDGVKVRLRDLLQTSKPVLLDFIYSSCTTTCPVLSAAYANVQNRVGADTRKVQLVSISIDPGRDTPQVMKEYLKRYHARPGWEFLTGSVEEVGKVLMAFRAHEMNDNYFTLVRGPAGEKWARIVGRLNPEEIREEYLK